MKIATTLAFLAAVTLLVGCATQPKGPACGHEREFRQQVEQSVPVKDWGHQVRDIRFSADYRKALVVFDTPGKTNVTEIILEDDGFRRYIGDFTDLDRFWVMGAPDRARTNRLDTRQFPKDSKAWKATIRVTFPKRPAYRRERQFRQLLTSDALIKAQGYTIDDVRFSPNYQKALVIFGGRAQTNAFREVILEHDGFRRYRGSLYLPPDGMRGITIDLPAK
jgi:hypothetical protein